MTPNLSQVSCLLLTIPVCFILLHYTEYFCLSSIESWISCDISVKRKKTRLKHEKKKTYSEFDSKKILNSKKRIEEIDS